MAASTTFPPRGVYPKLTTFTGIQLTLPLLKTNNGRVSGPKLDTHHVLQVNARPMLEQKIYEINMPLVS